MLYEVLNNHTRQRNPKLPDRLVSVLLARVVQTDTVLGRDERRRQIPTEHLFFRRDRALRSGAI
jgi:hypothetical protein